MKIAIAGAVAACLTFTVAVEAQELTVASWNLAHFSGTNLEGCRSRTQAEYDEIRRIINNVEADVWLFQEVESAGALARVMDPLAWTLIAESRSDVRPGTCNSNGRSMTMQRTAMAIRKGVAIGRPTDLKFLDVRGTGYLRYGLSQNITFNGTAIEIVNVHLKAGCTTGFEGEACGELFEQIPFLASYLSEAASRDKPVIIGGDFNRRLAEEQDTAMNTLAYSKNVGLEIASNNLTSRCSVNGNMSIDYILTTKSLRKHLTPVENYEYSFTGPLQDWPSDHCPTVVKFDLR